MNLRWINLLLLTSLAVSSSACSSTSPSESGAALAQSSSGAEKGENESSKLAAEKQMTTSEASKLATQHLALKNRSWGNVTKVTEGADGYEVHFETPEKELRLLGERVLMVDKESGLVTPRKRR